MDNKKEEKLWTPSEINRREFLKYCAAGASVPFMMNMFGGKLFAASGVPAKAKSVIEIWLWGGPSHLETFDPKPNAGNDYNGGFKAIPTNVKGMELSEFMPNLAKQADKFSVIRSMTHGVNGHETASYLMQTGRKPGGTVYPGIGALIGMMKGYDYGYKGKIPPYVVMTKNKGRFSETGFLNPKYKPLVTGGDPNAATFLVDGIVTKGVTKEQQKRRRKILQEFDMLGKVLPENKKLQKFDEAGEEAYELIVGDAGEVFNLSKEDQQTRNLYGRNSFGQSCLVARRLVQAGVPYITINFNGWDTHKRHFQTMNQKMPQLDVGLAALLADLKKHKLLDSTIVWCGGEFGRTPKVQMGSPWNGGRSHFGACFSALVAGGGFKGGKVIGASDPKGENPVERPVYPQDFLGSIIELMGIDPDAKMPKHVGKDVPLMPKASKYGRMKELYEV